MRLYQRGRVRSIAGHCVDSAFAQSLHAFAILVLLAVQWYAVIRAVIGKPVGWKGRAKPTGA